MVTVDQIIKATYENKLDVAMVRDIFTIPEEKLAILLRDLALKASSEYGHWHGFDAGFVRMIRQIERPIDALEMYVKYYISNAVKTTRLLPSDVVSWLITDVNYDDGWKVFQPYFSKVYQPEWGQKMVYESPYIQLFELMVEHQEIEKSLQIDMVTKEDGDATDIEYARRMLRLRAYVRNHQLCPKAELLMVKNQELDEVVAEYAVKWGLNDNIRDLLIYEVWWQHQRSKK